jgi:hypothetical protein
MSDKKHGSILGIPFDFRRPSLKRALSAHWQPGEKMLVRKPFGVGYTLNLANWRSWIAVGLIGALVFQERKGTGRPETSEDDDGGVEVVVDD